MPLKIGSVKSAQAALKAAVDVTTVSAPTVTSKASGGFVDVTEMRVKKRLKLLIGGLAGSGKTYLASLIAQQLGEKTAILDTQYPQCLHYADTFHYDKIYSITDYSSDTLIAAIDNATSHGCTTIIIDSFSHCWEGEKGIKDVADEAGRIHYQGNTFAGWNLARPLEHRLMAKLYSAEVNIIATVRAKDDNIYVDRKVINRGIKFVQSEFIKNEFNIVFMLKQEGRTYRVFPTKWIQHPEMLVKTFTNVTADSELITELKGICQ